MSYLPKTVFPFFSKKKNGITYQERESQDTKVLFFSLPSSLFSFLSSSFSFLPSSLFSLSATLRNDWKTAFKEKVPWVSLSDTTSFIGFSELMVIFVWRIFILYLFLSFSFLKHSCFPDFAFEGEKKLIVSLSLPFSFIQSFLQASEMLNFLKWRVGWSSSSLRNSDWPTSLQVFQFDTHWERSRWLFKVVTDSKENHIKARNTSLVPLSFLLSLFLQTSLLSLLFRNFFRNFFFPPFPRKPRQERTSDGKMCLKEKIDRKKRPSAP